MCIERAPESAQISRPGNEARVFTTRFDRARHDALIARLGHLPEYPEDVEAVYQGEEATPEDITTLRNLCHLHGTSYPKLVGDFANAVAEVCTSRYVRWLSGALAVLLPEPEERPALDTELGERPSHAALVAEIAELRARCRDLEAASYRAGVPGYRFDQVVAAFDRVSAIAEHLVILLRGEDVRQTLRDELRLERERAGLAPAVSQTSPAESRGLRGASAPRYGWATGSAGDRGAHGFGEGL